MHEDAVPQKVPLDTFTTIKILCAQEKYFLLRNECLNNHFVKKWYTYEVAVTLYYIRFLLLWNINVSWFSNVHQPRLQCKTRCLNAWFTSFCGRLLTDLVGKSVVSGLTSWLINSRAKKGLSTLVETPSSDLSATPFYGSVAIYHGGSLYFCVWTVRDCIGVSGEQTIGLTAKHVTLSSTSSIKWN